MGDPEADEELLLLLRVLPTPLRAVIETLPLDTLVEVVLDLGRPPEARLLDETVRLSEAPLTFEELRSIVAKIGSFSGDNRAGIERTLHRVSAIRNRQGEVIGLTLRVGRAIFGTIEALRALVESGKNILLLGKPGIGKTTKLREIARVLADELGRRVMVIDTSNEIAGDGDIPHPAIGAARRMQVPQPNAQHAVMIEAVENHMPEVIIVDEIGTEAEAAAARTIAERGVQLIGTAHGTSLENLVLNPTLSDLVGGVHVVTLGDEEARRRGTTKTVSERRAPPTFDIVVELRTREEVLVHKDTAEAVDQLLSGQLPAGELRRTTGDGGSFSIVEEEELPAPPPVVSIAPTTRAPRTGPLRIHPYALSRDLFERIIRDLRLDAKVVDKPANADAIIALRARAEDPSLARAIAKSGAQLHVVKRNSSAQIRRLLQAVFFVVENLEEGEVRDAVQEAEHAIERVRSEGVTVALAPRRPALRKLQHRLIVRHHLDAESIGREPGRHLIIRPPAA